MQNDSAAAKRTTNCLISGPEPASFIWYSYDELLVIYNYMYLQPEGVSVGGRYAPYHTKRGSLSIYLYSVINPLFLPLEDEDLSIKSMCMHMHSSTCRCISVEVKTVRKLLADSAPL